MKRGLHEHLRTGLDIGKPEKQKKDAIERAPREHPDPTELKRQRVERIAKDYLQRGTVPVFLSTRLRRGPFDGPWKNPWSNTSSGPSPQSAVSTEERKSRHTTTSRRKQHLAVPHKGRRDPSSDRGWLKRRNRKDEERYSASPATNRSPTPLRVKRGRPGGEGKGNAEQLSSRMHSDYVGLQKPALGHWRSSASASMLISSPHEEVPYKSPFAYQRSNPRNPLEHGTPYQTLEITHASAQCSQKRTRPLPVSTPGDDADPANASQDMEQGEPTPSDMEAPARRGVSKAGRGDSKMIKKCRASPEISSSFQYRRRGSRRTGKSAQPPKMTDENLDQPASNKGQEEAVNVVESPATQEGQSEPTLQGDDMEAPQDVYGDAEDKEAAVEGPRGEQQRTSLGSNGSRQSLYSTQAAMMLAQLEFQDGTLPDPSPLSPGSPLSATMERSEAQGGTPKTTTGKDSPAITPFHVFNAQLEKSGSHSARRSAPVSTQDLFLAASPFAFSAVKSTAAPKRSSLRFAVYSHDGEQQAGDADAARCRSPTGSADRLPLRDRNMVVSFTTSQKGGSQESLQCSGYVHSQSAELPRLDLGHSFDSDLSCADHILGNVDDPT